MPRNPELSPCREAFDNVDYCYMSTPREWPTDLDECHRLLAELADHCERAQRQNTHLSAHAADLRGALDEAAQIHDQVVREKDELIEAQRLEIQMYRRYIFGPRRERLVDDAGQGFLFEFDLPAPEALPQPPAANVAAPPRRRRGSRKPDFDRLPQVRVEHDLPEADKTCSCCGQTKTRIGEDEARVLEFIPARFELQLHILPKYACARCRDGVSAPEVPTRPISKCLAGAGVLAQLITAKFAEHQPLYRIEDASARYGLHLPRSTLCDWVSGTAELLRPLYDLQKKLVLGSPVIWTDDTTVTVLTREKPGSRTGRFWVYIGDNEHAYDVYDFTESRRRDGPRQFLRGYSGYLQADAYGGYDGIYLESDGAVREVACWAHARRKFFDLRASFAVPTSLILGMIARLYEIEDRCRPLDDAGRLALRQAESLPVLGRLRTELDRLKAELLPKSALAIAVGYALNQWKALTRYASDGRLSIDNNASERVLKTVAIGRKNWLFLGSVKAGSRAAVLSTIIAGAKRHQLEPWAYLRDVILTLSVDASDNSLLRLLPDRWAQTHPEHILTHRLNESREKARRRDARRSHRRPLR